MEGILKAFRIIIKEEAFIVEGEVVEGEELPDIILARVWVSDTLRMGKLSNSLCINEGKGFTQATLDIMYAGVACYTYPTLPFPFSFMIMQ